MQFKASQKLVDPNERECNSSMDMFDEACYEKDNDITVEPLDEENSIEFTADEENSIEFTADDNNSIEVITTDISTDDIAPRRENMEDVQDKKSDESFLVRDQRFYSNQNIDTKEAAALVFNVNNCINLDKCSATMPQCPPDSEGPASFVYVIAASDKLKPKDCTNDALCPWWKVKSSGTTVNYIVNISESGEISTKKATKGTVVKQHEFIMKKYYITHPVFTALSKSIFRCETDSGLLLQKDTFVVIMYKFTQKTELYSVVHGNSIKNKAPLVHIPDAVQQDYIQKLKAKKPLEARKEVVEQNGGYASAPAEVLLSRQQIYNLSRKAEDRTLAACGARKETNWDEIEKMKKNKTFVKHYYDGTGGKRMFFTNQIAIDNFKKNGLVSKEFVNKFHKAVDEAVGSDEPYTAARIIVEKEKKEERHRGCGVQVDTTFDVGTLLLTLMTFSNPHVRQDGLPVSQYLCSMLSEHRDGPAYNWMGNSLMECLGEINNKVARYMLRDGDRSLDKFQNIPIFAPPECIILTCGIHKAENMLERVPKENHCLAKTFVFGHTSPTGIHHNGIVDEITRQKFYCGIDEMLQHPAFEQNEALKSWFDSQKDLIYDRYGINSRLKAGFGFDTASTDDLECSNKLFKESINNRKLPLDKLIPAIETYCFKTLEYVIEAILHSGDFQLSKIKQTLKHSPRQWEALTFDKKQEVLQKLGYGKWFDDPRNSVSHVPLFLQKHLESVQRKKLEQQAIELSDCCLFDKSGTVSAVIDRDPRRRVQNFAILVDLKSVPLFCGCGYKDKGQLYCEHILAACYAIKNFDSLITQENYFKLETAKAAEQREYHANKGTKKNETRRRGSSLSRQNPQHAVEYRPRKRFLSDSEDSPSPIVVKRSRQHDSTNVHEKTTPKSQSFHRRRPLVKDGDFSTLPSSSQPATPFSVAWNHQVPVEPLYRKYIRENKITEIPCYFNDNLFVVSKLKEKRNAETCCCCKKAFNKRSPDIYKSHIIVHSERFSFPKNNIQITSSKERESFICPTIDCLVKRYPYFKLQLLTFTTSINDTEKEIFRRDFDF